MSLRLMVERGGDVEEHPLEGTVFIGRARDNHIILDAADVSRHHARIDADEGRTVLVDLGSANGTEVNGTTLDPRQPVALKEGDRITIASFVLRVGAATPGFETTVMMPESPTPTMVATESRLIIRTPAGERVFPLGAETITIGRSSRNDVVIPEPVVSKQHAILRRDGASYVFEDAGSANGTFVNGERIAQRQLNDGDVLTIGQSVSIAFTAPAASQFPPTPIETMPGVIAPVDHPLVVGRDASCDIILDHPSVSRQHARIGPPQADGSRVIEDLRSTNGTFVDGQRIASGESAVARPGSLVRVGPIALQLDETGSLAEGAEELGITAIRLRQEVGKGVNLLQDISLEIRPREFVAVVGVSGAGKSTLVGALSGLKPASSGVVLVNGADLYRDFDAFRTVLGFVPQDDILHRELPLERALEYTAALRLPEDTSPQERRERVKEVIGILGLEGRKDVPVQKLSGGQRKRVSIGAELLTRPGLFFLDEATSGLDPGTEGQLMRLLRRLADDGHTVVLITHATKNVMLCDKVAFLARGGYLAFYGPPEQALAHFNVQDFDGIYDRLEAEAQPQEWAALFQQTEAYRSFVQPAAGAPAAAAAGSVSGGHRPRVSWMRQFGVLSRRYLDIIFRDRLNLAILAFIAPIVGLIYLVAWPRDTLSFETGDASRAFVMAFLISLLPMILGSVSSTREIVKEAAVYLRERTVSLRIGPYVASKVTVVAVLGVWHALWLSLFWRLSIEMPGGDIGDWLNVFIGTFLVVLSGSTLGLLISAVSPREEQAVLLIIGVIIVQIVFSGGVLPLSDMGIAGTIFGAVTAANWGYQAMIAATSIDGSGCETPPFAECVLPGFAEYTTEDTRRVAIEPLDDRYGNVWDPNLYVAWLAMAAIIVLTVTAIYLVQRRKDIR